MAIDIMCIGREDLGKGTFIVLDIVETPEDIAWDFALTMARIIKGNNEAGRRTTMIVPVGPTGQYRRLAAYCNAEGIHCNGLVLFNMDEYCFEDGTIIPVNHPMSFRAFMENEFHSRLDPDKRVRDENKVFPEPAAPEEMAKRIEAEDGIDICFGGIGINGHIAFNEPPEPGDDAEGFEDLPTRVLRVSGETRVVNSVFAGGDLESVPPKCVTIGMREILGSRAIHMYLDWPWQSAVVRKTIHGSITPRFPASYLQTHPNVAITITEAVAAPPQMVPK